MIKLMLGLPGSGKTASAVRDLFENKGMRKTFSNIETKGIKNNHLIKPEMIVMKEEIRTKKTGEVVYELKLNQDFWRNIKEPINVILDEAHSLINSRRGMSKVNIIMTDWMALIRRVLGSSDSGYGELVLITQLDRRIDVIAREMATQIKYHVCHYQKTCSKCGNFWFESSEIPEPIFTCGCGCTKVIKHNHNIEVWCFSNISDYEAWKTFGVNNYYNHYLINDIEKIFPLYDTLQWDNMFSELY